MSAFHRLKAYFGMVPPEDMDAYAQAYGYDDTGYGRPEREAGLPRYQSHHRDRWPNAGRSGRVDDESYPDAPDGPDGHAERVPGTHAARALDTARERPEALPPSEPVGVAARSAHRAAPVRGSLAVDAVSEAVRGHSPRSEATSLPGSPGSGIGSLPLSRITTVQPRSYNEARTIGERYRDGIPVIINLTELDDAAAKRLVDFAAGLAFALRGSIDKVTNRVFLLSPAGVDPSAQERRRLAERGLFGQD